MTWNESQTVREIAISNPATIRVFESLGIDYCCGGRRPLSDACERANVPVARVLEMFAEADQAPMASETQWNDAPLSAIVAHIINKYHTAARQEIVRLQPLLEKVASKHGAKHSELLSIKELFTAVAQELYPHMLKEEQFVFPYIQQMEAAVTAQQPISPAFFGSVQTPIAKLLADHDDAGELTSKIRTLSNNYQAPAEACPSYLGLYRGLEEFERDLHQHVHLENNLLFPKAVEMERSHQHAVCDCH